MSDIVVYRFELWDRAAGKKRWAENLATPAAIRRAKGEADLESARTVASGDIDHDGYFRGKLSAIPADR